MVLAGGVGSRFWPVSTPRRPKQLLPLVSDQPLLADAVERLAPLVPAERTLVLTNPWLAGPIADLLPLLPGQNIIAEPRSAGTAPALAWAAREIERRGGSGAVMLSVHADWAIADAEAFRTVLSRAADVAATRASLVTVGVVPTRADPGFGYIQPAEAVYGGARRVARFAEKPDAALAERMIGDGFLWNSGIFAWRVGDFLEEVRAHTPEVAPHLDEGDIVRFFASVSPVSVDQGVLERSARVLVLAGDFGWDDVGTWAALARVRQLDEHGNAVSGPVMTVAAHANVAHAEGNTIVLYGVSDLVVVTHAGITLVTTMERATNLKALLDALPREIRDSSS